MADYDWAPDYSLGSGSLSGGYTPNDNIYDIWDGQTIGDYNPGFDASSQDWLDYLGDSFGGGSSDSGFWSSLGSLASSLGSGVNGLTNALGQSGLGTLAGMLGGAYGLANQYDWQQLLGQGRDLAGKTGSLISGYTPYTNQMVNMTQAQKDLYNLSSGLASTSQDYFKSGVGRFTPDQENQLRNMMIGSGTYDPTKIQSYLNPYVEGGLATANRLTSQNLTENILPTINSTFVGQGQFGSTRNADFQNRAIRDTQQAIADANAKGMVSAYGQASKDYMDTLKQQGTIGYQGIQTSQQGAQIGGGLANTGLSQASNLAGIPTQQYKDMYSTPLDMYRTWAAGVGNFNPAGSSGGSSIGSDITKLFGG